MTDADRILLSAAIVLAAGDFTCAAERTAARDAIAAVWDSVPDLGVPEDCTDLMFAVRLATLRVLTAKSEVPASMAECDLRGAVARYFADRLPAGNDKNKSAA